MKKLALALWILASAISVSFAEISDEEMEKLEAFESLIDGYDCLKNENPIACQALIDNDLPASIEQCNKNSCLIIGGIYEIAGYTDDAIEYYEQSLALGNYATAFYLGRAYYEKEDFLESKKYYEIACEKVNAKHNQEIKGKAGLF